ncbi:hypothetical protein RYX36_002009 [Vicia faba]
MFIDMMQHLQGLAACAGNNENSTLQEGRCLENSKSLVSTELDEAKNDNRDKMGRNIDSKNCLKVDSRHMKIEDFVDLTLQDNTFCDTGECQEETADGDETIPETPDAKRNLSNEGAIATEIANSIEKQTSSLAADACDNGMRDEELSPCLTNLIISGVVPESPIEEIGKSRNKFVVRGCISPVHLQEQQDAASLSCRETENVIIDSDNGKNVCTSPVNETKTPLLELKNCVIRRERVFVSQIEERHMHIVDPSINEESHPSCGEMSKAYIEPVEFAGSGLLAIAFVSMSSADHGIQRLAYDTLVIFKNVLEKCQKMEGMVTDLTLAKGESNKL